MKGFTYAITDPLGVHARPAGLLSKAARAHSDTVITIEDVAMRTFFQQNL